MRFDCLCMRANFCVCVCGRCVWLLLLNGLWCLSVCIRVGVWPRWIGVERKRALAFVSKK